jgi:hypothetical protein
MEVRRATLEYVQECQENLIHGDTGIDVLIEKNETIDPKSRKEYFNWIAYSLLGKGLEYRVSFEYHGGEYDLGCVSVFARQMAYYTDKNVAITLKGHKTVVPIKLLWKALRESLYMPMDEALTLALRSSAEIFKGGGDSYGVNPDEELTYEKRSTKQTSD